MTSLRPGFPTIKVNQAQWTCTNGSLRCRRLGLLPFEPLGGVSHFGEGWFGFVSDSLLSVQLSTDFEEQVHYGGQNAEQGSRSHRIARGVK